MRKVVHVIRRFDDIVVYSVPVELGGTNDTLSDQVYFDHAFRAAVVMRAVKVGGCDKLRFDVRPILS